MFNIRYTGIRRDIDRSYVTVFSASNRALIFQIRALKLNKIKELLFTHIINSFYKEKALVHRYATKPKSQTQR